MPEHYLTHPTFGLLSRLCLVDEFQSLYTTLFTQKIFLLITKKTSGIKFEPIPRGDAKRMVEVQMRVNYHGDSLAEREKTRKIYKRTFS